MELKENLFIAKRMLSQVIYNSAYLEGCNVTFPQTETILNGMQISGVSISDIEIILNLRNAWRYLLNNIEKDPLTVEYICRINEDISRNESLDWGVLRYGNVGVSGTDFIPPIPTKENTEQKLEDIRSITDPVERAVSYFPWAVKHQLFWDGNKRTSTLVANAILIQSGAGLFTVNEKNGQSFNEALSHYYNTDDAKPLQDFMRQQISELTKAFSFPKHEKRTLQEQMDAADNKKSQQDQSGSHTSHELEH